jgi:serine/threonine protein kinase
MSKSLDKPPIDRSLAALLAESPALPVDVALAIVRQLAEQVQALHLAGKLHGAISPESIQVDSSGRAVLTTSPSLHPDGDPELTPPELREVNLARRPTDIANAQQAVAAAGMAADTRRIDVYQLGILLCRMLTGDSVEVYLRSPSAKAKVPVHVQSIIDQALGYQEAERWLSCEPLLTALNQALSAALRQENGDTPVTLPSPHADTGFQQSSSKSIAPGAEPSWIVSSDLPFQHLGHYQIVGRIGHGGMGDIYEGYEAKLDRRVAIKVLPAELARNEDFIHRFQKEASAAAKIGHPNIIQIYFIGEDAGHHYFAMEYIDGESLAQMLAGRKRLPVAEALTLMEQCLAGLAAAHEHGLVHRDIKPGNILLDQRNRRALLADFGLVKALGASTHLTATGTVMGTVDYMPPEQILGQPIDHRADLYSLGVVLYQILSGRLPFPAASAHAMMFQHAYEPPLPLRESAPEVAETLESIVAKLLAKNPNERYQNAQEVLADLQAFRAGRPLPSRTPEIPTEEWSKSVSPLADPGRQGKGSAPRSRVIVAPDHDEAPHSELTEIRPAGRWAKLCDHLLNKFWSRAPEALKSLQNTQQQIDGAVSEYRRRRDHLKKLLEEAETVAAEIAKEAQSQRAAAAEACRRAEQAENDDEARTALRDQQQCEHSAAELERQLHQQRDQIDQIRLGLSKANATLNRLKNQRDVLNARLRAAEARLVTEGARRPGPRRRWLAMGAALVGIGGLLVVWSMTRTWRRDEERPLPRQAGASTKMEQGTPPDKMNTVLDDRQLRADKMTSMNQLRTLALAMHSYYDSHGTLPQPAIYGKDGQPKLSWRVALLPYLRQQALYEKFQLDEPWDGPHNRELLRFMPHEYMPPSGRTTDPYATFYQVFVGSGGKVGPAFEPGAQSMLRIASDFPDGASATILVIEAGEAVPWTKPANLTYDPDRPLPLLGGLFADGFNAAFVDASQHFLKREIDEATLRALITRNGGELIDWHNLE